MARAVIWTRRGAGPDRAHRTPWELGLTPTRKTLPPAGEAAAHEVLTSFLTQRGLFYARDISSPARAWVSSSHLSPYLAWGNLSSRQVFQASRGKQRLLQARPAGAPRDAAWGRSLAMFHGRMRWRKGFMQKLERDPSLEHRPLNRAFEGLRADFSQERFEAFKAGRPVTRWSKPACAPFCGAAG